MCVWTQGRVVTESRPPEVRMTASQPTSRIPSSTNLQACSFSSSASFFECERLCDVDPCCTGFGFLNVSQLKGNGDKNSFCKVPSTLQSRNMFTSLLLFGRSVVSDSFVTPWSVAHQAPLSMGFPRQEYCSGLPFPPPGDLLDPEIKPSSLRSPALADGFFTFVPTVCVCCA